MLETYQRLTERANHVFEPGERCAYASIPVAAPVKPMRADQYISGTVSPLTWIPGPIGEFMHSILRHAHGSMYIPPPVNVPDGLLLPQGRRHFFRRGR